MRIASILLLMCVASQSVDGRGRLDDVKAPNSHGFSVPTMTPTLRLCFKKAIATETRDQSSFLDALAYETFCLQLWWFLSNSSNAEPTQ